MAGIPKDLLRDLSLATDGASERAPYIGSQDGMDLGMVAVNWETMTLEFAGANSPLYVVRQGELQERKSDKFAICSDAHH